MAEVKYQLDDLVIQIMDRFSAGGSFAELHPSDFREDFVVVGHEWPHHIQIDDGRTFLCNLTCRR